jgi:hypothetical protein
MIVFFEYGRLGNQLFQYSALKKLYPDERVILIGFEDLDAVVAPIDSIVIKRAKLPRWLPFGLLKRIFQTLLKLRVLTGLSEKQSQGDYEIEKKLGLFFWVRLFQSSFFQNRRVIESLNPSFEVQSEFISQAKTWLSNRLPTYEPVSLVFVHIRRGDYLTWPSRESPAILSLDWYLTAMDELSAAVVSPVFIITTDDPLYANDIFKGRPSILISDNNQYVDFALMTLCQHGILSASSFAWWGAWFSKKTKTGKNLYLAPKYWGGHRSKTWIPEGFISDWITYIE